MSRIERFEDMKASPYPPSPLTGEGWGEGEPVSHRDCFRTVCVAMTGEERDLLAALSLAMTEGRVETARLINRFIRCPRRVTNDC